MSLLLMLRISKYYVIPILAAKLGDVCTFVNPRFSKSFLQVNVKDYLNTVVLFGGHFLSFKVLDSERTPFL